jgi:hypothetical protein
MSEGTRAVEPAAPAREAQAPTVQLQPCSKGACLGNQQLLQMRQGADGAWSGPPDGNQATQRYAIQQAAKIGASGPSSSLRTSWNAMTDEAPRLTNSAKKPAPTQRAWLAPASHQFGDSGAEAEPAAPRPVFHFGKIPIQAKLTVGAPGDALEVEADETAERVIRMADPVQAPPSRGPVNVVQRMCGKCSDEHDEDEGEDATKGRLQRKAAGGPVAETAAPAIVHEVLRSPGQPLDAGMRAFMEPRFGYDFSGVELHTDAHAAASAEAVGARAYTVGQHIVLGSAAGAPGTAEGRALLAHELAHVVQQGQAAPHAGQAPRHRPGPVVSVLQRSPACPSIGVPTKRNYLYNGRSAEEVKTVKKQLNQYFGSHAVPAGLGGHFPLNEDDCTYDSWTQGLVKRFQGAPEQGSGLQNLGVRLNSQKQFGLVESETWEALEKVGAAPASAGNADLLTAAQATGLLGVGLVGAAIALVQNAAKQTAPQNEQSAQGQAPAMDPDTWERSQPFTVLPNPPAQRMIISGLGDWALPPFFITPPGQGGPRGDDRGEGPRGEYPPRAWGAPTYEYPPRVWGGFFNNPLLRGPTPAPGNVRLYRIQGGSSPNLNQRSRFKLTDDGSGNVRIGPGTLTISDAVHAEYYQFDPRPGGEVASFEVPRWLLDFIEQYSIPQRNYRSNPRNQEGFAPKIVDPRQPGRSYELNELWAKWLEEQAIPGSFRVGTRPAIRSSSGAIIPEAEGIVTGARPPSFLQTPKPPETGGVGTGTRVIAGGMAAVIVANEVLGTYGSVLEVQRYNIELGKQQFDFWKRYGADPTMEMRTANANETQAPGTEATTSLGDPIYPRVTAIDTAALGRTLNGAIRTYRELVTWLSEGDSLRCVFASPPLFAEQTAANRAKRRTYRAVIAGPPGARTRWQSIDITGIIEPIEQRVLADLDQVMKRRVGGWSAAERAQIFKLRSGSETPLSRIQGAEPVRSASAFLGPDPWVHVVRRHSGRALVEPANADARRSAEISVYQIMKTVDGALEEVQKAGRPITSRWPAQGYLEGFVAGPIPGDDPWIGETTYTRQQGQENISTIAIGQLYKFWVDEDQLVAIDAATVEGYAPRASAGSE